MSAKKLSSFHSERSWFYRVMMLMRRLAVPGAFVFPKKGGVGLGKDWQTPRVKATPQMFLLWSAFFQSTFVYRVVGSGHLLFNFFSAYRELKRSGL